MTRVLLSFLFVLALLAAPARAMDIQRVTTPSGIEAWLVEDHANPVLALEFDFRGSAALDPDDKQGLARLAASTMDEGAGDLDSAAFQGLLEDRSITLRYDAGLDRFGGTLRTLTEHRNEAFRLLRLSLTQPRFDAEPVERIRRQILSDLRRRAKKPSSVADRTLFARLFPDHPYGRLAIGTEDGVAAVTAADLRTFVKERIARDNLIIAAVGDVTPKELSALIEGAFGALPAKAKPWAAPETKPAATAPGLKVVDMDVPQSAIVFAQPGVKRDDPDYFAAYLLNHILGGGGFGSRVFEEVREKRGLAYSVHTSLSAYAHAGVVTGHAGTANTAVGETLKVLRDEWARIAKDGVNEKELQDAKTYVTGAFPLRFTSSGGIAQVLNAIRFWNLGIDYIERRKAMIEAVTLEDVNRVARDLLDPDKLAFVVVGRPEGL